MGDEDLKGRFVLSLLHLHASPTQEKDYLSYTSNQLMSKSKREYCPLSFSPRHFQTGLRVYFGKNIKPTFLQNWNPWSHSIPYITFGWHKGNDVIGALPVHMQLDPFQESLVSAITDAHNALQEGVAQEFLEIVHNEPIMIEVYCGFSPILHNYTIFGFNRDRGKFGF